MNLARRPIPFVALSILCLFLALWAGLVRIGWNLDPLVARLPQAHGPLMISGFLGTLIGVERAVALSMTNKSPALYAGPMLSGLGSLALLFRIQGEVGMVLVTLGSASMAVLFAMLLRRFRNMFTVSLLLGAAGWLVGNIVWLAGKPVAHAVWWWAGFLVFTIAGERLELSRIRRISGPQRYLFIFALLLLLAGLSIALAEFATGVRVAGASLILLAIWLFTNDIARSNARQQGLTRFVAISLLSGYGWLGIAGVLAIRFAGATAGPYYDAVLHALFLGFVMAMIFAHAPIIFPSVLGRPVTYSPRFYSHLALLNGTLLLRIWGDLAGYLPARQWGALLNVLVLLLFLANTIRSTRLKPESRAI